MDPIKLWKEKKWLFFLLLPVILIVMFRDVLISLIAAGGHKKVDEADVKDRDLAKKANEANVKADVIKAEADALEKKIEDNKVEDIPEDWHNRDDWNE